MNHLFSLPTSETRAIWGSSYQPSLPLFSRSNTVIVDKHTPWLQPRPGAPYLRVSRISCVKTPAPCSLSEVPADAGVSRAEPVHTRSRGHALLCLCLINVGNFESRQMREMLFRNRHWQSSQRPHFLCSSQKWQHWPLPTRQELSKSIRSAWPSLYPPICVLKHVLIFWIFILGPANLCEIWHVPHLAQSIENMQTEIHK